MESNRSRRSRLKRRLARMFRPPSLLRSSCNPSTSAATILSSTTSSRAPLINDIAHEPAFIPSSHRRRQVVDDCSTLFADDGRGRSLSFPAPKDRRRHRADTGRLSVDCGGCRPARDPPPLKVMKNIEKGRKEGKSKKKERRVRETGGFYETGEWEGRTCPPASPSSPSKSSYYYYYYYCLDGAKQEDEQKRISVNKREKTKKKKKKKKKLLSTNAYGFSSSSSIDSDEGDGFFSSGEDEAEEETETLFSSRSFSSDSSEFYQRPLPHGRKKSSKKKKKKGSSTCPPRRRMGSCNSGLNVSAGFRPMVSISSEKKEAEKRGFAVVKRSSDPYADFRSSMVEMIIGRQIFGGEDLEKLLQSYLSLNSPHHHPVILQAFSDIWVVLFGN